MNKITFTKMEGAGNDYVYIDLSKNQIAELRNKYLGFIFQFHHLLPDFTAYENVLIQNQIAGKDGDNKRATELLNNICSLSDHLPNTYVD